MEKMIGGQFKFMIKLGGHYAWCKKPKRFFHPTNPHSNECFKLRYVGGYLTFPLSGVGKFCYGVLIQ